MDESGFESQTIRPHGYAPIGKPCIDSYNWQGKKRTNVIGALYEKMLFALDYFEHNINSGIFYDWCKHTLIPSLKTKCVIVMDNARFHKSRRIQKLLNRHGHRILWLPPYSPDLNPIEKKWAQVKFLRQGWMENDLSKLFYDVCPSHNTFVLNWLYIKFNIKRYSETGINFLYPLSEQAQQARKVDISSAWCIDITFHSL